MTWKISQTDVRKVSLQNFVKDKKMAKKKKEWTTQNEKKWRKRRKRIVIFPSPSFVFLGIIFTLI